MRLVQHGHGLCRLFAVVLVAGLAACAGTDHRDMVGPVYYACADRSDFSVTFDNTYGVATVERASAPPLKLAQQVMGSGFRYSDGANELTGKGREATWHAAGVPPVPCTAH
ncbi:MAG: MliC family protein [Candidatus Eiseniibacteriota bacterium]